MTRLLVLVGSLLTLAVPTVARAQVSGDDLGFSIIGHVEASKAKPALVFKPTVAVGGLQIQCKRSDGQMVYLKSGPIKRGQERRVEIPQGKGVFQYDCQMSGKAGGQGFGGFVLQFEVKVGDVPKISLRPEDVDEAGRKITVKLSEPAGKLTLDILGDNGQPIDSVTKVFAGEAPGTPLTIEWKQDESAVVAKFMLQAYDPAGYWSGIESVTFVDIPHEDVVFESGKADILPTEEPKLLTPLADIQKQLQKVQGVLTISLYIGGYTDTVGKTEDNQELSRKRAQAIAQWFAKKGLQVQIFAQGFGERALRVQTPDNTDEARNRRASYVLSVQPPPANRGFPSRDWQRIR
jgi:outer membrane protein OmpA-like peptidoglycan-associated protein